MKTVTLRDDIQMKTREVLKIVLAQASERGVNIEAIRRRVRVLNFLDAAKDSAELQLEDADWEFLKAIYNDFQFASAHRDFLTIADDIIKAATPPQKVPGMRDGEAQDESGTVMAFAPKGEQR